MIGRDISESLDELGLTDNVAYNVVASRFNGFAFFNIKYGTFSKETSKEFMKLLNRFIVHYCAANDWTFVLATNPYYYIEEHLDTEPYGGESYAMELTIIRSYGYNRFADGLTWETIPCPGTEKIAYFKPSCHVVEKSKLQKV